MANKGVEILVVYDRFPEIAVGLEKAISQVVRKAAFDIQAYAASIAPVDTGFLKSSIYVVTKAASTYGIGVANPPQGAFMMDEVPTPNSDQEAIIAVGANYGVYLEFGTVHMDAQPYMTPAAEAIRPSFEAALSQIEGMVSLLAGIGSIG